MSPAMPSTVEHWGVTKKGFPLIIEEDLSNLLSQEMISESDGYSLCPVHTK